MRRDIELDPHDRVLAAVVRQAIADYHQHTRSEYEAAQSFLGQLGLLGDAGEVRATEDAALMLGEAWES